MILLSKREKIAVEFSSFRSSLSFGEGIVAEENMWDIFRDNWTRNKQIGYCYQLRTHLPSLPVSLNASTNSKIPLSSIFLSLVNHCQSLKVILKVKAKFEKLKKKKLKSWKRKAKFLFIHLLSFYFFGILTQDFEHLLADRLWLN